MDEWMQSGTDAQRSAGRAMAWRRSFSKYDDCVTPCGRLELRLVTGLHNC